MNKQSETKISRVYGTFLYVKYQYKGICTTCGKYRHNGKEFCNKKFQTYKTVNNLTNQDITGKTAGKYSEKKK